MMDLEELYLSEAKQHHQDLTISIRETRNKSWQLFGGVLAIEAYLITSEYSIINAGLLCTTTALISIMSLIFRFALEPLRGHINGLDTHESVGLTTLQIIGKYRDMIDETTYQLDNMSDRFKWALYATFVWSIISGLWFLFGKPLLFQWGFLC